MSGVLSLPSLLLLACAGPAEQEPPSPPPAADAPEEVDFHHLSQGSGMLSLKGFLALERADSDRPFREDLSRFGLIEQPPSPSNPHGLPIGLAVDQHPNMPFETVGQTCAACHVGRITLGDQSMIIDGGPGLFESKRFFDEFVAAFALTLADKDKLFRFVGRISNPDLGFGGGGRQDFASAHPLEALIVEELGRLSAEEIEALRDETETRGRTLVGAYLHDGVTKDHAVYHARLEGHALLSTPAVEGGYLHGLEDAARRSAISRELADAMTLIRLTLQTIEYTSAYLGATSVPFTRQGPGRIDAFGMVRAQILSQIYGPEAARPLTGPASIPHLWNIQTLPWLHWQSNMNSVVGRNTLEAIGSGAVLDFRDYDTWADLTNLAALESHTYAFAPPAWPSFFPPLDAEMIARGEAIYHGRSEADRDPTRGNCVSCHAMPLPPGSRETATVRFFTVEEIGVDGTHAHNWAEPVQGRSFAALAGELLPKVQARYYEVHQIPEETQIAWEGGKTDTTYRVADAPLAGRPLQGVWATAPYLHNGSVPTLYHLLLPPEQRPSTFPLGHTEYDPVRIGYRTDVPAPAFVFDVDAPVTDARGAVYDIPNGNGNGGHAYGVALSEDERMALLEYLKTL